MAIFKHVGILFAGIVLILAGGILVWTSTNVPEPIDVTPGPTPRPARQSESAAAIGSGSYSGTDTAATVVETIQRALADADVETPDFAFLFVSGGDFEQGVAAARKHLPQTKIFGSKSGKGIALSDKPLQTPDAGTPQATWTSASVMVVDSDEITFGVGSSLTENFDSPAAAAQAALRRAMRSAELEEGESPSAIVISPQFGKEQQMIDGLQQVVGRHVPMLGGAVAASCTADKDGARVAKGGISVAVIKTDLAVGSAFEAGFEVLDPVSAQITNIDGRDILEFDGRPALDVYDDWFDGEVRRLCEANDQAGYRQLRNLNPVCKRMSSADGDHYYNFTVLKPNLESQSLAAQIDLDAGDRLYLCRGSWETLMNRICFLPVVAKAKAGIDAETQVLFGIGFFCGGVVELVPASERNKFSPVIRSSNNGARFLACISASEQGFFPGIGTVHGQLSTSFLVIAENSH